MVDVRACVGCKGSAVFERPDLTAQGYRRFRCRDCGKQFNERSGGLLNRTQYPSDIIALVVFYRLRYKLSLRDLAEMFLLRGIVFSYEAVRQWEATLTPSVIMALRQRRGGGVRIGRSWYGDETYMRVRGRWYYLYRAIDWTGRLVDARLSQTRDMAAAITFFEAATTMTGTEPSRATPDGYDSYPRAIRTVIRTTGKIQHRTNRYLNNRIEQDHRGIKSHYGPMKGFGAFASPAGFCAAFDELRHLLRFDKSRCPVASPAAERAALQKHSDIALKFLVSA